MTGTIKVNGKNTSVKIGGITTARKWLNSLYPVKFISSFVKQQEQEIILSFLSDEEKKTFMEGCGLYHLFTDEEFYKQARDAISRQIWGDAHKAV